MSRSIFAPLLERKDLPDRKRALVVGSEPWPSRPLLFLFSKDPLASFLEKNRALIAIISKITARRKVQDGRGKCIWERLRLRLRKVLEDGGAHFGGVDFGLAVFAGEEVAGAEAGVDGGLHGGIDGVGCDGFSKRVAEHHGDGKDLGDGVGDALSGDVGGGAAGGFIHAEVESVFADLAEAGD